MEIKDVIRKKREELNLTYEQLGNMVGVGKSTVRKWETGMIENMRRDNIMALAKALNLSPSIIMGWNNDKSDKIEITTCLVDMKETKLINSFNKLNETGKDEALKRISELTEISKYIENEVPYIPTTIAAHDDDLTETEKEVMNNKIMEALKKHK
ncbi:MAG: helix-turn-helix domain-containing protein [Clostridium sp.]